MAKQKRNLSRQRVIEAAIDYTDHHGISALTLPTLARELHVRSQSLYNYVANRNELISLAGEELLNRIYDDAMHAIAGLSGRQAIIKFADIGRNALLQHQSLSFIIVDVQQVEKNQIISAAIQRLLGLINQVCEQLEPGAASPREILAAVLGFAYLQTSSMYRERPSQAVDDEFHDMLNHLITTNNK